MVPSVIAAVAVVAVAVFTAIAYNRLASLRQEVAGAWAGIDAMLAQRAFAVPMLTEAVRGARDHERAALEATTRARALERASGPQQRAAADRALEVALSELWIVAEATPALQSNDAFAALQTQLVGLENDVAASRRFYNGYVRRYNQLQRELPWSLVARAVGERTAEYYDAEGGEFDDVGGAEQHEAKGSEGAAGLGL